MKSSEIITRARSLADIPNSKFITNSDETESLWESYKDIYSKITDSSDDYYISSATLYGSDAVRLGENEYEIDLPSDCYKIRFVNYKEMGNWVNMDKFNINQRNYNSSRPMYRFREDRLWVITGGYSAIPTEIRIDYYPPPIKPSVPDVSKYYCTSYQPYELSKVLYKVYTEINGIDYLLYIYNGTSIYVESLALNTKTLLYTGTGLTQLQYYAGYIYFVTGGDIFRAPTTMLATIVPTEIVTSGSIVKMGITAQEIVYVTATETYEAGLDGSSPTLALSGTMTDPCTLGGYLLYINATGFIVWNGTASTIAATRLATDGADVFYLTAAGKIKKVLNYGTAYQTIEELGEGISFGWGDAFYAKLIVTGNGYIVSTLSTLSDTDFSYPLNEATELMAYQCAIDFKRKENGDTTKLEERYAVIMDRFTDQIKRDEYQAEHRVSEFPRMNNY